MSGVEEENESRWSRAWRAVLRFGEALGSNPVEDMLHRVERLEREVATLKAPDLADDGSKTSHNAS